MTIGLASWSKKHLCVERHYFDCLTDRAAQAALGRHWANLKVAEVAPSRRLATTMFSLVGSLHSVWLSLVFFAHILAVLLGRLPCGSV